MDEFEKKEAENEPKTGAPAQEEPPTLPNDFFAQLLNLPPCKSKGFCNNCGRCER